MSITIDLSALGDGTYTIEDDGIPGNGISVVRDPIGNIITTFAHPADALAILSRAGQNININITDSLTTANVTVGNIDNAFAGDRPDNIQIGNLVTSGTVTLAANQTVRELGNDSGTDIIGGALLVRAGTGIGTGGNFIETQVSAMEAESDTGGIAFSNLGDVALHVAGAAGDLLRGLWTGTTGNITLINQGSILLADTSGIESVHSGGNLQLMAIGGTADISSNVNRDALLAVGNINLSAGRDVLFGTVGADFDNDVRAGGSITVTAGRDFHIDGFSDLASDDRGLASNGGVSITAGRNILIEDDNGVDASVGVTASSSTGAVILTTGVGGTLSLAANSSAAIQGRNGGVIINADRILIDNDSGINVSGTGILRITGASAGRLINVGSATDGLAALELSDAELDRLTAQNVIIGSANSGQASVVGAITHANPNLTIESGADILVAADITTPGSLTLRSGESVFHDAGSTITTPTLNVFVDTPDLDGPGGTNVFDGTLAVTALNLSGSGDADTLRGIDDVNQVVHGNGGGDTIISSGEGQYFGDAGDDTIVAGPSSGLVPEVLDGGAGIDTLDTRHYPGSYVINLATGATNFAFESFVNFENVLTGGGADTITGSAASNSISTGFGNDSLDGAAGADILNGGLGDDRYYLDNLSDQIVEASGGGTDILLSSVSYVLADGVFVEALSTRDWSATTAINLTGNSLDNSMSGNAGANLLDGGGGVDAMQGFGGNDRYYVDDALDRAIEAAGGGTDIVLASVSYALADSAFVESLATSNVAGAGAINLTGNVLDNSISGNAGVNVLIGNGGNDSLVGLGGADTLQGGAGNDSLFGGLDADTLTGGTGADSFRFDSALGGGNIDTITDFAAVDDTILLDDAVFAGLAAGALPAGAFVTGTAAGDANDRIIYNSMTGALLFDADGTGAGAAVQFATLQTGLVLTAGDFAVI